MTLPFFTPARRPENEEERQRAVEASGILDLTDDPALEDIIAQVAALFDAPMAAISILDRDRQWFAAKRGLEARSTSRAAAFCGHTVVSPDGVLSVPDARTDARFAGNPLVLGTPNLRFYVGAALVTADGHALGSVCALDDRPRDEAPDAGRIARLEELSREVAGILQARALRSAA